MRVFVSAGEPSGDLHGANLTRALRRACPDIEVVGFGGDRMAEAGCQLIYPLANHAVMGIGGVLAQLPQFIRILGMAGEEFRRARPDAVVMIDNPGFHWWLADCAKKQGIPVSYFVPPQLWAWAGWRAKKMRRLTDQVLASLPFEQDWFRARGIQSEYIGHPYFDELTRQRLDEPFLAEQQRPGPVIAILPGSRQGELTHNLTALGRAASLIHAQRPDSRFLVACLKAAHAEQVRPRLAALGIPIEVHHGRTPEIIHLAHSVMSVSGSVSLELLYRCKPAVMLYCMNPLTLWLARRMIKCQYGTLVNLLADRLLYPEYATSGDGSRVYVPAGPVKSHIAELLAGHMLHWLDDTAAYATLRGELAALKREVAQPGACDRAAAAVLALARGRAKQAA